MRPYLLLIAVALLTAFAAGTLSLDLARGAQTEGGAPSVPLIKAEFEAQHAPHTELDLGALFPPGAGTRLVDPRETLPQSHRHEAAQITALARFAQTCRPEEASKVTAAALAKALAWHRAGCGLSPLPPSFFEAPPFMHPAGTSFASLSEEPRAWALEHQRLFHVGEWRDVTGLSAPRALLARLSRDALGSIAAADPLILDEREVLLARIGSADGAGGRRYSVYPRADWDRHLARAALIARPLEPGEACAATEGQVCWARNEAPYFARLSRLTATLLALAVSSMGAAGFLLLRRVQGQRGEEQRQRFILQTLTHELRTPVSSLLVSVESLRRDFDALGPDAQRDLLRVVDDAHRLRRLAEQSKAYLHSAPGGRLLSLAPQRLDSIQAFAEQVLEPWRARITLEVPAEGPVCVDPYWAGTCLANLVENALKHGATPVRVTLEAAGGALSVCVTDAGQLVPAQSVQAGLGLGLSIVRRAVEAMGGKLDVREHPTRFAFRIPAGGSL